MYDMFTRVIDEKLLKAKIGSIVQVTLLVFTSLSAD